MTEAHGLVASTRVCLAIRVTTATADFSALARLQTRRSAAPVRRSRPSPWPARPPASRRTPAPCRGWRRSRAPSAPTAATHMGLEILRRAVVERERVDREARDLALLHQPLGRIRRRCPGKCSTPPASLPVYFAASPTCRAQPEFIATQQLSGSRPCRVSQAARSLARELVVGILRRLGRHVDHRKRHDQRLGRDLARRSCRLRRNGSAHRDACRHAR